MNIYLGSITSYEPTTGQYYVRLHGSSFDTLRGVPCRTLSPTPYEGGAGIKSAPVAPVDTQCLIAEYGQRRYILGFCSPHGIVAHGDIKPVRDVNPGDIFLTHSTPSRLGILAEGTIIATAAKWAKVALNPITQQFTATIRNLRINLYSAILEFFADESNKKSTARITMGKWINPKGLPLNPPDGTPAVIPDNFTLRAGTLDDSHIIELSVNQKYVGDTPQHTSSTLLGKQNDGTYLSHSSTTGAPGDTTDLSVSAKDDGTLHSTLSNANGNVVDTMVDTKGTTAYRITVNGKTAISISQSGDVQITTPDGAAIKFGGQGNEQALATKSFVEQIYKQHTHTNGNAGGPTGPPLTPVIPPVTKDDSSNAFTFTTQAE